MPKVEAIQPITVEEVDSTSVYSSSDVFSAKDEQPPLMKHDSKPTERVNPFDKNTQSVIKPTNNTSPPTTSSSVGLPNAVAEKTDYTASSYLSKPTKKYDINDETKSVTDVSKDPTVKAKPVIQAQPLIRGEYRRDIRSNSIATNSEYTSTKYNYGKTTSASDAESGVPSTSKFDINSADTKSSESKSIGYQSGSFNRSRGSLSDADIVFGDLKTSKNNSRDYSSFTSSTESDNIFGPPDSKVKSSVHSTDAGDDVPPMRSASYKIYDGIQNHAFQDFDSPLKGTPTKSTAAGDDYDLK